MSATAATEIKNIESGGLAPKEEDLSQKISWEKFEKEYLSREDDYTYEWLDGYVQKTKRTMNKYQLYILNNLQDLFISLLNAGKTTGKLVAEADLFFINKHRRPDLCWITKKQFVSLANGNNDVPSFIIEVVSKNDISENLNDKMDDYRAAGVQIVWQIFPANKQVHVYSGERLKEMHVFTEDEVCSAAPALPDFKISVNQIFEK